MSPPAMSNTSPAISGSQTSSMGSILHHHGNGLFPVPDQPQHSRGDEFRVRRNLSAACLPVTARMEAGRPISLHSGQLYRVISYGGAHGEPAAILPTGRHASACFLPHDLKDCLPEFARRHRFWLMFKDINLPQLPIDPSLLPQFDLLATYTHQS